MRAFAIGALLTVLCGGAASGQDADFESWLNRRIDDLVAARIEMRDPAKAAAAVAATGTQSPLVDRGAVPDVVGIAVHLPGQGGDGGAAPTTAAFSGNPLALLFGLLESGALDPAAYLQNSARRRLGLNLTFDVDAENRGRTLLQARYLLRDRGNVLADDASVSTALQASAGAYGRVFDAALDALYQSVGSARFPDTDQGKTDFENTLTDATVLAAALTAAGDAGIAAIDEAIRAELESFLLLRTTIDDATALARRRPLIAIGLTGELTETTARQLRAGAIWDVTRGATDFTLNAGWNYVEASADLPEVNRAEVAGQLLFRLIEPAAVSGGGPLSLAVAGSAGVDLDSSHSLVYKLQAKMSLPLAEGINVPLSATWSNRRDQIHEDEIRGHVGFSFDLAQLTAALR